MTVEKLKSDIKKRMDNYFNKSFEVRQRIEKGDKNSKVLEKCEQEYSSRGLELSWVLELFNNIEGYKAASSKEVESEEKKLLKKIYAFAHRLPESLGDEIFAAINTKEQTKEVSNNPLK